MGQKRTGTTKGAAHTAPAKSSAPAAPTERDTATLFAQHAVVAAQNVQDAETAHAIAEKAQADDVAQAFTGFTPTELVRLHKIIDLLPCYVVLLDEQHHVRFYNKAFQEFFGKPCDTPCYTLLHNLSSPCQPCPPMDALKNNASCAMEWVYPKDKHAFRVYAYPFEEDGCRYLLKVGFNVTANVRVQQALDLSEQSYRAITDNLSIGIAMLSLNMNISAGNSRLGIWFGQEFSRGRRICEVLKCNGAANVPTQDNTFCPDCPFQAAIANRASHEKEFTVTFQDGGERVVRLVACPVSPPQGGVRALIMMLEDITNRLRVNQQLQRVRKLEAMGTLAGGIAHEINQPLSALHLYASGLQMLLEKQTEVSAETTQDRLGLIMREAEKIRSIITHMRSLVMQEGKVPLEAVNVLTVLRSTLGIMKNQLTARGITVVLNVPAALPSVRSNAVQLEQVLINLIGNAVHALDTIAATDTVCSPQSADGATPSTQSTQANARANTQSTQANTHVFRVSSEASSPAMTTTKNVSGTASQTTQRRIISISTLVEKDASRVLIEVADNGPGLPKGSERIFDPFYTTKESHQGMGLGLSIVHGLVSLWGGEVHARAHHPTLGGAVFCVTLPVFDVSATNTSATDTLASGETPPA